MLQVLESNMGLILEMFIQCSDKLSQYSFLQHNIAIVYSVAVSISVCVAINCNHQFSCERLFFTFSRMVNFDISAYPALFSSPNSIPSIQKNSALEIATIRHHSGPKVKLSKSLLKRKLFIDSTP